MTRLRCLLTGLAVLITTPCLRADDKADLESLLAHEIIGPHQSLTEVKAYLDARVPRMPKLTTQTRLGARSPTHPCRRSEACRLPRRGGEVARCENQGRMARHHQGRRWLSHQEAALRGAARNVDTGPPLRARQAKRQGAGRPGGQRPRSRQRQGGRLQANALHQHGETRHHRAECRMARHGPAAY